MNRNPERALWIFVFETAIRDLCAADGSRERIEALAWLGTHRPTRDFTFVAFAAGIDPEPAWAHLHALAARPDRLTYVRKAFGAAHPVRQAKRSLRRAA